MASTVTKCLHHAKKLKIHAINLMIKVYAKMKRPLNIQINTNVHANLCTRAMNVKQNLKCNALTPTCVAKPTNTLTALNSTTTRLFALVHSVSKVICVKIKTIVLMPSVTTVVHASMALIALHVNVIQDTQVSIVNKQKSVHPAIMKALFIVMNLQVNAYAVNRIQAITAKLNLIFA